MVSLISVGTDHPAELTRHVLDFKSRPKVRPVLSSQCKLPRNGITVRDLLNTEVTKTLRSLAAVRNTHSGSVSTVTDTTTTKRATKAAHAVAPQLKTEPVTQNQPHTSSPMRELTTRPD
ncbi:hypothetical protein BaRGS_00025268 [Batillaria attramentaria]|uniref:Uncharacterized protein n=1 Tax=Batillaria attramentaria TaxID=370345 RepID=A0ABD0K8R9_9CAEN